MSALRLNFDEQPKDTAFKGGLVHCNKTSAVLSTEEARRRRYEGAAWSSGPSRKAFFTSQG